MSSFQSNSRRSHFLIRIGKIFVIGVLLIFVLIALLLLGISLKGRYDLAKTKEQLRTQGEKLTLAELAPPSIPDEQNFFADPMWMELADLVECKDTPGTWTPRIPKGERQLDGLARPLTEEELAKLELEFPEFTPLLAETPNIGVARKFWNRADKKSDADRKRAAEFVLAVQALAEPLASRIVTLAERDGARFLVGDQEILTTHPDHYSYLIQAAQFLWLRSLAELALGHADSARQDCLTVFKLADTLAAEPLLISFLVRVSIETVALSTINKGIKWHVWSDNDLTQFENRLAEIDLPSWLILAFRGERAWLNQILDQAISSDPQKNDADAPKLEEIFHLTGFSPRLGMSVYLQIFGPGDQAAYNQFMQEAIDVAMTSSSFPSEKSLILGGDSPNGGGYRTLTRFLSSLARPAIEGAFERALIVQTQINQTRIACALERFRLAGGKYPESMAELVPEFLAKPLLDEITAQPMCYKRLPDEKFLLWSVGWNETDEGGQPGLERGEGDWVWGERIR